MPNITANGVSIHYEQQGSGEPIVLIPYLSADNACYAFQVAEYAKHFTCITVDLRGTGESDKPDTPYTTETLADDVAAFMAAIGVQRAHIAGLSLGGAVGIWLAGKYPSRVKTLSLHDSWHKSDLYLKTVVESFQITARALNSVPEMVICSVFPWCLTPEFYAAKPDVIEGLAKFVRSRPVQPVPQFILQSNAVIGHDASSQLSKITAPTQITVGRLDQLTSLRMSDAMKAGIKGSELVVFEGCSHAPIYEKTDEFNARTLKFLREH